MSLDALAPDQRAVVQLVLQQDRSYEELAGLLGISADAVRERAHRGLERLAPGEDLTAHQRGEIVDYLLGQQPVSGRGETRTLLTGSPEARAWARTVAGELEGVARGPLPEVPAADGEPEPPQTPVTDTARGGEGVAEPGGDPDDEQHDPEPAGSPADGPSVRARPRPRGDRPRSGATPAASALRPAAKPRSSRLGGALILGAAALVLAAVIVFLVTRGGDDPGSKPKQQAAATPTATATPDFQPLGSLPLSSPGGGAAKGQMVIFASPDRSLAFTIQGTGVPRSRDGEAYAVWLTGGGKAHRLGFAPPVKADGKFGTSGPRESDARRFGQWFSRAKAVVVARETTEDAGSPGPVVLRGTIPQGTQQGG